MEQLNGHGNKDFKSGDIELDVKLSQWLNWDKNEDTSYEILQLAIKSDWRELRKRLLRRLEFGTAGLRGVMKAGFSAMNDLVVIQTAQGLAQYLLTCYPNDVDRSGGVVIGYDGRYNSEKFAKLSACVFLNHGIPVLLYSQVVATPFVPFAIIEKKCIAGIMVTASHNPKDDNGYKVYWGNGPQIITPHDKEIQKLIFENLEPLPTSWDLHVLQTSTILFDPFDEMYKLYFEKLHSNIPITLIDVYNATSNLKFVYSAMHGVGYKFIEKAFQIAQLQPVIPVQEQKYPDPEFPTVKFPNPEEGKSSLELALKLADEIGCNLILANDPDADRLACAERNPNDGHWKVFTGNELGALLGWWAIECYKRKFPTGNLNNCYMLASTVSSKILRAICEMEGLNFIETLTGFKWMGNKSVELLAEGKEVLFAFEEAIGFMFSTTVLDKDGVSAACHLATMCCYLQKSNQLTLSQKLNEIHTTYGHHITCNSYYLCYEPQVITRIFNRLRNFKQGEPGYPTAIGDNFTIRYVRDLTSGYDSAQENLEAILPISRSSQMITFTFDNGVVLTLRTSGTEPKIKYYAEMCAKPNGRSREELLSILHKVVVESVIEFLQPHVNNIIEKVD